MVEEDKVVDETTSLYTENVVRDTSWLKFGIELPMLAILFSISLTDAVTSNLLLYRTCKIDLHYNETKCRLLHMANKTAEVKELENEVEAHTTLLLMTVSVIGGLTPAILSVFIGAWSDKHGRKALVLWPLLGQIVTTLLIILYCHLNFLSSWWFVVCILPYNLLGGIAIIALGANLIITDVSKEINRSFRLSLLYGFQFSGILLGSIAATYLFDALGYIYLYGLAAAIYVISYLYVWLCVKESLEEPVPGSFIGIFDIGLVKETCSVIFKRRRIKITLMIILLVSAYGITMFSMSGTGNVSYFFTRVKFQWLLKEYNIFSAFNMITIIIGMFFGVIFFQKICKISDGIVLVLSYISSIADAVVRCFATKTWHMYLAGAVSFLGGLSPPMIRSQLAKIVPNSEVAKMYSLITCVESILPVFAPLLFNTIYYKTLITFPAAIYAVSAGLFFICLIFVMIAEIIFIKTTQNMYTEI